MSLAEKDPQLVNEFLCEKNPGLKPDELKPNSNKRVWWRCKEGHEYITKICHRTASQSNCPECNPHMTKKYEESLVYLYPEIAEEWHPDNILTASQVSPGSGKKVKWKCLFRPHHVYEARVAQRVKGHRCPNCQNAPTLSELRLFSELSLTLRKKTCISAKAKAPAEEVS